MLPWKAMIWSPAVLSEKPASDSVTEPVLAI